MASRIIIDGYNLLCAIKGSSLTGDIEEMRSVLIELLTAYKKLKNAKITLVFDGAKSGNLQRGKYVFSGIEVIYTRERETADDFIKNTANEKGPGLTVVTSDRDICAHAERKGAVCVSSEEFYSAVQAAKYYELKGVTAEDEDGEMKKPQKGPSKRPSKKERAKIRRLKKL